MSRMFLALITVACVISLASGCRNCRLNPCNNACGFGASPTLPAPPTYSLQIPSLGKNQPYYNGVPITARQPSPLINPNSAAPTPASSTPTLAPQQGWRPVGTDQFSNPSVGSNYPNSPQNQPTSVLQSPVDLSPNRAPTGFASQPASTPPLNSVLQPGDNRTAAAANGVSYTDSVNYRSTHVDERLDETRLPVTDASNVRAPSTLNTAPPANRFAQAVPIYGTVVPSNQPAYSTQPAVALPYPGTNTNPYRATQNAQPTQPGFIQGTVVYGQPANNANNGYPSPYGNPTNAQPAVLAQSTTTINPQNGQNYQSGWRDRELTARR